MLGWALKKGFQSATGLRDAPEDGEDTTHFEAPDTPAPVFAARAIKNAIWGQPIATERPPPATMKPTETKRVEPAASATSGTSMDTRSPTKPNSILLTPGTGASRRKRVSFGRDVKAGNNVDFSPLAANSTSRQRKKTTLQQALENSRSGRPKKPALQAEEPDPPPQPDESDLEEEDWEDDVCCNHDVTVDLNEPHSESGKYWKAEFTRYRDEAKSDIEQLVKYKANAKSFAAKKDAEASQLNQKLKEEQAKVAKMEEKIADMAAKMAANRAHGTDRDNIPSVKDLARQTSLVVEYRERVKDLEARLKEASSESKFNRSNRHRINTSPRTEQNILDVSRELRKARSELRQLDRLRDETKRLKSDLATSRQRVAELESEAAMGEISSISKVHTLEKQLREANEESRQRDAEIKKLKREYESLKRNAKSRTAEAMQVLQDKNTKIDELEQKIKDLETVNASNSRPESLSAAIAEHNKNTRDLKSGIELLGKPSKYEQSRPTKRHERAASVEDITLDMTQRSLLKDEDEYTLDRNHRREKSYSGRIPTEWTAVISELEPQLREKRKQHEAHKKRDDYPVLEDSDAAPLQQAARIAGQGPSDDKHRVMSDVVLSNRVNHSSLRDSRGYQRSSAKGPISSARDQDKASRTTASARATSLTSDKAIMRGALDQPVRRPKTQLSTGRPLSPGSEALGIDLIRDHFSRLGGHSADRTVLGNTSRCTLPADRQAAARARLEQKKMERRKASSQALDKENVRPQRTLGIE